jgi:hypothetical protein
MKKGKLALGGLPFLLVARRNQLSAASKITRIK